MKGTALLGIAALVAVGALSSCSGDDPTVCVSTGGEPGTVPFQREPDYLCRDDHDVSPVFTWVQVPQGTAIGPVGGSVNPAGGRTPSVVSPSSGKVVEQPSGAAQEGDEEGESAGVSSSGSSSATSGEESEESATSSSASSSSSSSAGEE